MRDDSDGTSPSRAILKAVADAEGVDPIGLHPPLADVIDPVALDRLFANTNTTVRVVFEYIGYEVTVHSDGTVDVEEITV